MSTAQAATNTVEKTTPKTEYQAAIGASLHDVNAINISEKLLDRLLKAKVPSAINTISKQISEALNAGEHLKAIELSESLKEVMTKKTHSEADIAQLKKKYTFEEVISIFSTEYEGLVFEAALDVLKQAHISITAKKPRGSAATTDEQKNSAPASPPKEAHISGPDGKKYVVQFVKGPITITGMTDLLKAVGIDVKETEKGPKTDDTIKLKNGTEVPVSRRNVVDAIKEGVYEGFTVTKDETVKPKKPE
ncbi:hypothetical protein [Pseudomonas fluorescens]